MPAQIVSPSAVKGNIIIGPGFIVGDTAAVTPTDVRLSLLLLKGAR